MLLISSIVMCKLKVNQDKKRDNAVPTINIILQQSVMTSSLNISAKTRMANCKLKLNQRLKLRPFDSARLLSVTLLRKNSL